MKWLLKSEPGTYSFSDLTREGRTCWDGVSNPAALGHLRAMQKGDEAFFYHTGDQKAIVGIARIVSDPYPDPNAGDARRVVVDVEPVRPLRHPVPLAAVKADPRFRNLALVRIGRLSVMPVPPEDWKALLAMS